MQPADIIFYSILVPTLAGVGVMAWLLARLAHDLVRGTKDATEQSSQPKH